MLREEIESWHATETAKAKERYQENEKEYTHVINELRVAYEQRVQELHNEFKLQQEKILASQAEEQAFLDECNVSIKKFLKETQGYDHLLLQVRIKMLNDELDGCFSLWYPGFKVVNVESTAKADCPPVFTWPPIISSVHSKNIGSDCILVK